MSPKDGQTPDWRLERLALGELPRSERDRIQDRLEQEPDGETRLSALESSNRQILERYPPEQVAAEIRRRAAAGPRSAKRWQIGALVAAPAIAAGALLFVWTSEPGAGLGEATQGGELQRPEQTRSKGLIPHLLVARLSGERPEGLRSDDEVVPGDRLQLGYVAVDAAYGALLSIDGGGEVTLHLPVERGGSTQLTTPGEVWLGFSYELDDAPGFERFFLVTADRPLDVEGILSAARDLAEDPARARREALALPAALQQHTVLLRKPGGGGSP